MRHFYNQIGAPRLSWQSNLTCSLTGSRTRLWSRVTRGSSLFARFTRSSSGRLFWLEREQSLEPLIQGNFLPKNMSKYCVLVINLIARDHFEVLQNLIKKKWQLLKFFNPQKWKVHIANLRPHRKWLSSEISDPKASHAYPCMQTWQVPCGVFAS